MQLNRAVLALGVAASLGLAVASLSGTAAHEGHDHGPAASAPPVPGGAAPARLADGSVYLPKPTQRLLGIRTAQAKAEEAAAAVELAGRVVADPNASARVPAPQEGRIEPGEKGFPHPGQQIARGDVIAWLVPTLPAFDESQLRQRLAEIEKELALLLPRAEHLGVVNPNMPMGDATVQLLQEIQIQAQALNRQAELVKSTLRGRIAIEAPMSGTAGEVRLAHGQSVGRGETLLDIVDRRRARVEAYGFGNLPVLATGATAVTEDGRKLGLVLLGTSPVLRQQAAQLVFDVTQGAGTVRIGELVRVLAGSQARTRGLKLPASAVQRAPGGGLIVWEHMQAEIFRPRRVTPVPIDADSVLVTGEVTDGMRVVVAGAELLAQVR